MQPILIDLPLRISTPRFFLRAPEPGDGRELNAAISDSWSELREWMPWARQMPTVLESEEFVRRAYARYILREDLAFLIFDKKTGRICGATSLHKIDWESRLFELGYWRRSTWSGQGCIAESTNALIRFAFSYLSARRLELRCNSQNVRSVAVAKRLNFSYEGCLRDSDGFALGHQSRDTLIFARLDLIGLPSLSVEW